MPDEGFLPVALSIVMDTYEAGRMKEMTQNVREIPLKRSLLLILTKLCQNLAIGRWGQQDRANTVYC